MGNNMLVLCKTPTTPKQFVSFWEPLYEYRDEQLYDDNIALPPTADRVIALFKWKNGGKLSARHRRTVEECFVQRIPELAILNDMIDAAAFLRRFSDGGAIFRIFWLHLWRPLRYPMYDQHVHRAMTWIQDGNAREPPSTASGKIHAYVDRYLPFVAEFGRMNLRRVDRALWACGKHLKAFRRTTISLCL
jgi:hypothetical protein